MGHQDQRDIEADERGRAEPMSQRVRHLLAVARAAFVARGLDAVSIDAIARAGGVSKETIYRHFADKEALFRAALEAAGEEFTARAEAVHRAAADPRIELAELARAILDSAQDQGMFSALWVAASVAQRMPDLATSLQEGQWRRMEPVRHALEDYARRQGVTRPVPLDMALDFGSLAVEGPAVLMGFPSPPPADRQLISERVARLFSQGVTGAIATGGDAVSGDADAPVDRPVAAPHHIRTLLDVAGRHFLDQGYEGASLDLIGAEARVGRGTLYRHFGSKAGLFAAAVRQRAHELVPATLPTLPQGVPDRVALVHFVEEAIGSLASESSIQLHRIAISQSRRDGESARAVFAIVRAPWVAALSDWLASLGLRGDLSWYGRELLVLAIRGNRLFAGGGPVSPADRRLFARRAVTIFLDGFVGLL
jgi:AcrR family transcriptional regulator